MAYYCGTCGAKLQSQIIKTGSEDMKTGTTKRISYKVLIEKTVHRYKCPNGCILTSVSEK